MFCLIPFNLNSYLHQSGTLTVRHSPFPVNNKKKIQFQHLHFYHRNNRNINRSFREANNNSEPKYNLKEYGILILTTIVSAKVSVIKFPRNTFSKLFISSCNHCKLFSSGETASRFLLLCISWRL